MVSAQVRSDGALRLEALYKQVRASLERVGASFHCGAFTGPSLGAWFAELRTEIRRVGPGGSRFWPTLRHDASCNVFILEVPYTRLRAHAEYKKVSYLLRAHADYCLQPIVGDAAERNSMAWQFSDRVRFPDFDLLGRQLEHTGSFERLHAAGIPLSQLLGCIARHHRNASLVSLYGLTRDFEDNLTTYNLVCHRTLGEAEPHYEQLAWAHNTFQHDITLPRPQHLIVDEEGGDQTILLTDSVWCDADPDAETDPVRTPMVSITRTVVWSHDRNVGQRSRFWRDGYHPPSRFLH